MLKLRTLLWFVLLSSFILASCTKKDGSQAKPVVNLAIWSNYIALDSLAEFEKKHGIKVQMSNYSSNEELLAKLQAGASGYDVAVPSDYMVYAMGKLGLVQDLDHSQIPNIQYLDKRYMKKKYDPENKYSIPYNWGTTGIAINRNVYTGEVKSWKQFFEKAEKSGKFSLLDDSRETIGAALKSMGYSINSKNPDELQKAKALLLKVKSRIKVFTSEPKMPLVHGDLGVAHAYMSDTYQANREAGGNKIEYVIPEEGTSYYIDNWVIPKGATHIKEAHLLINFLIDAQSSMRMTMNIMAAPANVEALKLLPKEFHSNAGLFPSEKVLSNCEMMEDLGEAAPMWDRIWMEVKAAQ